VAGASFTDIATTLGLSSAREALQLVERELANRVTSGDVEQQRAEASLRLERLIAAVWDKATNPDHPEQLPALRTALALVDRHIRLHGLDRPTEIVVHNPTMAELERWVTGVLESAPVEVIEADVAGELGP